MTTLPKYLIYIVEDDDDDRLMLQQALQAQAKGCIIRSFNDGAELFTQLTHQLDGRLPNLIFLDLETPVMNGFDTLQLLKQSPPYQRIPVIMRTGHATLEAINRCYGLGCQAYLTKEEFGLPLAHLIEEQNGAAYLPPI